MENKFGNIIRHGEPPEGEMPVRAQSAAEVDKHIETHVGKPTIVVHELASRNVHVDVHIVPPNSLSLQIRLLLCLWVNRF
jgi:hypothetical protein